MASKIEINKEKKLNVPQFLFEELCRTYEHTEKFDRHDDTDKIVALKLREGDETVELAFRLTLVPFEHGSITMFSILSIEDARHLVKREGFGSIQTLWQIQHIQKGELDAGVLKVHVCEESLTVSLESNKDHKVTNMMTDVSPCILLIIARIHLRALYLFGGSLEEQSYDRNRFPNSMPVLESDQVLVDA